LPDWLKTRSISKGALRIVWGTGEERREEPPGTPGDGDNLLADMKKVHLLPFSALIGLPKNIRDIARELGKEAELVCSGKRWKSIGAFSRAQGTAASHYPQYDRPRD
jgi:hypothetical protein